MFEGYKKALNTVETQGFPLAQYLIPEASTRRFKITHHKHKKGEELHVIDPRMSFTTGLPVRKIKLQDDWTAMRLSDKTDGVLMSTIPIETFSQIHPACDAYGHVLVGGLGLGYVVEMMSDNRNVTSITIVEKEQEIIDLVGETIKSVCKMPVRIVKSDICKFLKTTKFDYDYIYLDTWSGTGESTFYDTVLPLRKLAQKRLRTNDSVEWRRQNICCWMEEVMRGQVLSGIVTKHMFQTGKFKWNTAQLLQMLEAKPDYAKTYGSVLLAFIKKHGDVLDCMHHDEFVTLATQFVDGYKV